MDEVRTFCRICEPSCGLVAHVDDGRARQADARPRHPVTKGFACHKGLAAVDVHHDPDRLDRPDAACRRRHVDRRCRGTRRWRTSPPGCGRSSPSTAPARSAPTSATRRRSTRWRSLHVGALAAGPRRAPHVLVGHAGLRQQVRRQRGRVRLVHGAPDPRPRAHRPVPDHRREPAGVAGQLLLDPQRPRRRCAGRRRAAPASCSSTPAASRRPTAASATPCSSGPTPTCGSSPPCCTRSTRSAASTTRRGRPPRHATSRGCARSSPPYPADRVAAVTGVDRPTSIRELAAAWVATPRASVHASTGINMGRQGTLGLLARAHAVVRHRPPRRRGRQPEERRLLRQRRGRAPACPSRATSTPSSAACAAVRCPAR